MAQRAGKRHPAVGASPDIQPDVAIVLRERDWRVPASAFPECRWSSALRFGMVPKLAIDGFEGIARGQ